MKLLFSLLVFLFIVACSPTNEYRFRDMGDLERPPVIPEADQRSGTKDNNINTDSEKTSKKGLNSDVYLATENEAEIGIKRNFDEAWAFLSQAIRLNELKIIDKNQSEGKYEVSYQSGGLLAGFNLFGNSPSTYRIKLDAQGNESRISVMLVEDDKQEDPGSLKDGTPDYSHNNSSKLRDLIFDTLQNDVRF